MTYNPNNIKPKAITLILPVYKVERYILKCLNSINDQTFKDFDVVIVDDRGNDNSISIAQSFLAQTDISYTIVHNKQNLGISETRNAGLAAATADYVLFIDPDDWIENTMLEELYTAVINSGADIVACNGLQIWEKDGTSTIITSLPEGEYTSEAYLKHLLKWETTAYFWLRLFKRSLYAGISFHKDIIFEDFLLFPYLVEKSKKIIQIDSVLYNYIRRNDSITLSKPINVTGFMQHMQMLDAYFKGKVDHTYIIKYNYTLLYFFMFNLFKYTTEYKKIEIDIRAITNYITINNLLKIRKSTTTLIWFVLLVVKLNGRIGYFLFKKWQGYKK
jgi:glycosyltransferase involved in cell wall biosynthesis